jgi:hypothetical protein
VKRVLRVFPETKFDKLFEPGKRYEKYTYEGFLEAVSRYPQLCNEQGGYMPDGYNVDDLDKTCMRELSIMFAHFNQETGGHVEYPAHHNRPEWQQGLWYVSEYNCVDPDQNSPSFWDGSCSYKTSLPHWTAEMYPPQDD